MKSKKIYIVIVVSIFVAMFLINHEFPVKDGEIGVINKQYNYGDVRRYGVLSNQDIDDQRLLNAISSSEKLGVKIEFPSEMYDTGEAYKIENKINKN